MFPAYRLIMSIILICCFIGIIEATPAISIFIIVFFFLGIIIISLFRLNQNEIAFLHSIFAWGYLLRLLYGIMLYYWLISIHQDPFLGGGDDKLYDSLGKILADLWGKNDYEIPFFISNPDH